MSNILNGLSELIELILVLILCVLILFLRTWQNHLKIKTWREARIDLKERKETKQSLEELGYPHSEHYAYIASTTPLWVRLQLSKHRGNRRAISWRIKLLKRMDIIGPQTAELLMEEYMITAESAVTPAGPNEWTCPKCGTYNPDTALFCKDCGEYK